MTRTLARLALHARRSIVVVGIIIAQNFTGSAFAQVPGDDIEQPDVQRAEGHAARAYRAYAQKDYATAVTLYIQAYQAAPAPDILYNIARIYEIGLRDRAMAIAFYRDFVVDPDADATRIRVASARLKLLEEAAGVEPAPPVPSAPADAPSDAPPQPASARPEHITADVEGWSPLRAGAVVAASAGLVAVGLGAVFGVDAMSQAKVAHDDCNGNACTSERGVSAVHAANKSADVATVGFALGGLLIATGAVLLAVDREAPRDRQPLGQLSWSAQATDAEIGLALSGRW